MTKENRAKFLKASLALKKLGMTPYDFITLDMAACFECWAEDAPDGAPLTVDIAMELHSDTGYFKDIVAKALEL